MDVGELIAYLQGYDTATPVVIDVNTSEGVHLRVEADHLEISADEGDGPDGLELAISWEAHPGWVQRLIDSANQTRAELGLEPL